MSVEPDSPETIKSIPDTTLADLISDVTELPSEIFLDRDPAIFQIVLNVYRYKKLVNALHVDRQFLREELDFYNLEHFIYGFSRSPVPTSSPTEFRKFTVNRNPGGQYRLVNIYPDAHEEVYLRQPDELNDVIHLIHELKRNNGAVVRFKLDLSVEMNALFGDILSKLILESKTISEFSIVAKNPRSSNPWIWVTSALDNPKIVKFTLHCHLTGEDAHRIRDHIRSRKLEFPESKQIRLENVGDETVPGILSLRPFYVITRCHHCHNYNTHPHRL
jgi:hypothetical protein